MGDAGHVKELEADQKRHTGMKIAEVRPWLGPGVRLGLATVWLIAGGAKVGDLAESGRAVAAFKVLPVDLARVVGAGLPFVELVLGLLLVVGLAVRLVAGISAALLVVYIGGIAAAWARGLQIDCGCFGGRGQLAAGQSPNYAPDIARDLGFLPLAVSLLAWPRTRAALDNWLTGET